MTYNYFYKITNNINGHYYYGVHQTDNLADGYMGSGKRLNYAYDKYGQENFTKEILKYFDNPEDMYQYEKEIVTEELVKSGECYNISIGGNGGNTLSGLTDAELEMLKQKNKTAHNKPEYITKISQSQKEVWKRDDYRKKQSERVKAASTSSRPEVKEKLSKRRKQYYIDHPEARKALSENNPAKRPEVRAKMRHPHKPMSEEAKQRIKAEHRHYMNDGVRNYRIPEAKIPEYLEKGYILGGLKKK